MTTPCGGVIELIAAHARPDVAVRSPAVSLLTEPDAFFTDHHHCGDLDAGVDWPIVWIACPCGARMARRADERNAVASDD